MRWLSVPCGTTLSAMGVPAARQQLAVLTHLGHCLPGVTSPQKAVGEVVRTLIRLGVAVSVSTVEADEAIMAAARAPRGTGTQRLLPASARLMGIRIPIDRVPWLSGPVRLRRPFVGSVQGIQTLNSLAVDHEPAGVVPAFAAPIHVVGVPVMVHDRVVAVIHAWSAESLQGLVPTLEAVAAMLAGAWEAESRSGARRFSQGTTRRASPQLRSELTELINDGRIATALQPIVRLLDRSIVGYEALPRFSPRAHFSTPDELFAAASALHMEKAVDLACLRAALGQMPTLGPVDLFINVLIGTLLNERQGLAALEDAVRHAGLDPASIVLEFSERDPVPNLSRLQHIAAQLRSAGYRIAVDDAGAGHASMQVIAELRPEFMKVDRALIHGIDSHRARRGLLVSLLSFSGHIGARLVAEGVETQRELDTLLSVGVQYGQGWMLGRPVLTQPLEGLSDNTIIDPNWFTRHRVWRLRTPPAPTVSLPEAPGEALEATETPDLPRALSDAAQALQNEHDPMGILSVIAAQMQRVADASAPDCKVTIVNDETQRMVPVLATGPDRDALLGDSFGLDTGITGWAFARGTPENVADTWAHPRARQVPGTAVVQESLLLVPLVAGERKLGIINCYRMGVGRFSDDELKAASLFAHIAAAAWHNAQLYAELREAAVTDPLTGLYNNRWLRDAGERDLASSARDHTNLALLLLDIDHFKTVNDSSGHAAGDLVLQRVATRLRGSVRTEDAVVRYGGEEFVVLLRRCSAAEAVTIAEALRTAVRQVALPADCPLGQLTVSIGIAAYPEDGIDLAQLLGAADRAMYTSKHAGRNRVTCAPRAATANAIATFPGEAHRSASASTARG